MMTKVALFQYMISNGYWGDPSNHNIKLIFERNQQTIPFVVPYDFDHSGFVNADYALPPELFTERFGVEKVTERVYWGYPRTMDELQTAFNLFREKKNAIISLITNFQPLTSRTRKWAIEFINEFYGIINDKAQAKTTFIDNARRN